MCWPQPAQVFFLHSLQVVWWHISPTIPNGGISAAQGDGPCYSGHNDQVENPLEQLSLDQLRRRTSAKWKAYPADVLPLWVAEMDVMPARPIADAVRHAIDIGDTGYSAGKQYPQALADFAADRWGWSEFPAPGARIVPDVMVGIVEVLRLVTSPGDPVVVNCPVYPPFYAFVTSADRQVVESPLTPEGRIDLDHLAATFHDLTQKHSEVAYLLCSPHNPTGTVHSTEELQAVAALAQRHGVRVVVDEIHAPLVLPGAEFVPYLSVPGSESAFSLMSASKAWNLAGLKAAVASAGAHAQVDLDRMPEEVGHGASHLGVIAHTAALRDGGDWLDALLDGLTQNRDLLCELVSGYLPQLSMRPPQGTYLAWLDCCTLDLHDENRQGPGIVVDLEGPAKFFLDEARVGLNSGHVFGTGGSGHVRLNFATSQEILTDAVQRMAGAVAKLR